MALIKEREIRTPEADAKPSDNMNRKARRAFARRVLKASRKRLRNARKAAAGLLLLGCGMRQELYDLELDAGADVEAEPIRPKGVGEPATAAFGAFYVYDVDPAEQGYCGDGRLDPDLGERCDLGPRNGLDGYPCGLDCRPYEDEHYCGDGTLERYLGEECDRGRHNGERWYPCDFNCQLWRD